MQLRDDRARFAAAGLGIVAIGQGSAAKTKEFAWQLNMPFPLLADPRRVAYDAYGLGQINLRRELNLSGLGRRINAVVTYGARNTPDQDVRQLGGIFVVNRSGIIRYAHRQQRISDVPPNDALLAVVGAES